MKNTQASDSYHYSKDDLLPEYDFDYRRARPNRFASNKEQASMIVTLDPDVAEVFTTSEAVLFGNKNSSNL